MSFRLNLIVPKLTILDGTRYVCPMLNIVETL